MTKADPLDLDEMARLGVYDPGAPDAEEKLALIRYVLGLGATTEEVAHAGNLGELALDLSLRPREGTTLSEVVAAEGTDWPRARRLLAAAGLPVNPEGNMSADEVAVVRMLLSVGSDLLGDDATVQLGRVAGNAMARVAEALVSTFRVRYELPQRAQGVPYVDVVKEYVHIAETLLPEFVRMLDVTLRRHILAVVEREWSTDAEQSVITLPRTVGFADLVGYTSASVTMSVGELSSVLLEFDERTAHVVLEGNGQIVKTIGDEAMFVTEDPADACRIAIELIGAFGQGQLPPVRVGLATGQVLSIFGDAYGPDVNLAARLVRLADPSTVVASSSVQDACADVFRFEALPPREVKGFAEEVRMYRLVEPAG